MDSDKPFGLAVSGLVLDGASSILVIRRSKNSKRFAGQWDLPGGKVNPSETFEQALLREVMEETGLVVRLEGLAGATESEMPAVRVVHLILRARVVSGQVVLSDEHDEYRWIEGGSLAGIGLREPFASWARTQVR